MKLKVCGMKETVNILEVADLKPDYMGFIFYKKSPRYFSEVIPDLSPEIKKTGVFVNASLDEIIQTVTKHSLNAVQLHGNENSEFCRELGKRFKSKPDLNSTEIIKVFSVLNTLNKKEIGPFEKYADYFLFDTKGKLPGGNGYTFDWTLLTNYDFGTPFFLSGGIGNPETEKIKDFMKTPVAAKCHAVDINSRFELQPGLKDVSAINKFKESLDISTKIN